MNLFEGDDQIPENLDNVDFLAEITKPGAKFDKTKFESNDELLQALAKKAIMSDRHISTIEHENNGIREQYKKLNDEYNAGLKLQDYLDRLENQQNPPPSSNNTPNANEDRMPAYNPEEIESLVSSKIQQHEQNRKETENFNDIQGKVRELYGDNYKQVLKQKADTLGLNEEDINRLARTNPKLFSKTFDLDNTSRPDTFQTPPRSDLRSDAFTPRGNEKRTWSYYQKMRKDNPNLYLDPKIRVQMDKDAQALGADFFDH